MTITNYQVQNVLRTYGRHLLRGKLAARQAAAFDAGPDNPSDSEDRRKQVIHQIVREMIRKIALDGITGDTEREALGRLSREVGRNLEIVPSPGGGWHFQINGRQPVLPDDNLKALQERFYQITYEIIDHNTLKREAASR